jgi:hypothetical protein
MIDRMHVSGAALIAAAMLGSCSGGGGGAVVAMEPGQWEMTMRVINVRMDNLPAGMRTEMSQMRNNESRTSRDCLTVSADVVRIRNLRFTVPMPGPGPAPGCRIAELSMESGNIRGEMSCEGLPAAPFGNAQTMSMSGGMNGTYTARSLDLTARGEMRMGAQNGSAEIRITGRRIGACPPPRPYAPPPSMVPQSPPVMVPQTVPDTYAPPPSGNLAANAM